MRTLFFECAAGAAGDMLTAALLELMPDPAAAVAELDSLGLEGVRFSAEKVYKCGVGGTLVTVSVGGEAETSDDVPAGGCHGHAHSHEHAECHEHAHSHGHAECHEHEHSHEHGHHAHVHRGMDEIAAIIGKSSLSEKSKSRAAEVYGIIADAESEIHGKPVTEIHFHEVGMMDAIADISAVCHLIEKLAPERIVASPVCVGSGHVRCAHGILPVPAPATALILRGVPVYAGNVEGELCTPTGAALLKAFAEFSPMPQMSVSAIGYGMGKKDLCVRDGSGRAVPFLNCVRAYIGEA